MNGVCARLLRSAGLAAAAAVLVSGAGIPAASEDARDDARFRVVQKGRMEIVTVDEEGNEHREVIEFDGDHPRAFLGVRSGRAHDGGALIEGVVEGSAAQEAGLREGDVIVGIDGREIRDPWTLTAEILKAHPGDVVDVDILRDGRSETVSVELGEREDGGFAFGFDTEELEEKMERLRERLEDPDLDLDFDFDFDFDHAPHFGHGSATIHGRPRLGVQLTDVTPELREHLGGPANAGVLVAKVLPGTPAEEADVRVGDLIVALDGRRIEDSGDLIRALRDKDGDQVRLDVVRDGLPMGIDVFLPRGSDEEETGRSKRLHGPRPRGGAERA